MEKEIKWSAPEFHYYHKDATWYWVIIIATVIITALALWQQNFLFAIFIILAAILVVTWGKKEPPMVDFTLSEKGLDIAGRKFYPIESLSGFAIVPNHEDEELSELVLKSKSKLNSWTKIIIATQRTEQIKTLLKEFLTEVEYEESLSEHLARILKF